MLIAMDAEAILTDAGARRVVTVSSVAEAQTRIRERLPDVAVLDVNLGVGTSVEIAEDLARLGVPFVFATGYGDGAQIPDRPPPSPGGPQALRRARAARRHCRGPQRLLSGFSASPTRASSSSTAVAASAWISFGLNTPSLICFAAKGTTTASAIAVTRTACSMSLVA